MESVSGSNFKLENLFVPIGDISIIDVLDVLKIVLEFRTTISVSTIFSLE